MDFPNELSLAPMLRILAGILVCFLIVVVFMVVVRRVTGFSIVGWLAKEGMGQRDDSGANLRFAGVFTNPGIDAGKPVFETMKVDTQGLTPQSVGRQALGTGKQNYLVRRVEGFDGQGESCGSNWGPNAKAELQSLYSIGSVNMDGDLASRAAGYGADRETGAMA